MSIRTSDLDRRLTVVEEKLIYIDQYGTRGVGTVQTQMADVKADMAKLEASMETFKTSTAASLADLKKSVDGRDRSRWQVLGGYVVALIPVYILLFLTVGHK